MPIDKSRITGFGSDGSQNKIWKCPQGHMLQPWKASPGTCDGCGAKIHKGDNVMDCRQCNWYLCETCHPQEKEQQDWFWGSVSYLVDAAQQEFTEVADEFKEMAGEFETFVGEMNPLAACSAPQVDKNDDESCSRYDARSRRGGGGGAAGQRRRGTPEEEDRLASGNEGDDDGDDLDIRRAVTQPRRRPRGPPTVSASASAAAASSSSAAAASSSGSGTQAGPTPEAAVEQKQKAVPKPAVQPAAPPEDLMDFGQHDLLDLDVEPQPTPAEPVPAEPAPAPQAPAQTAPAQPAPAQPAPVVEAQSKSELDGLLFPTSAPPVVAPQVAQPATAAAMPDLLLDLSGGGTEAQPAAAAPAALSVAAPAAAPAATGGVQLLDFDPAPARTEGALFSSMMPPPPPASSSLLA